MVESIINTVVSAVILYLLSRGAKYLQRYLKRRFPSLGERTTAESTIGVSRTDETRAALEAPPIPEIPPEATPQAEPPVVRPYTEQPDVHRLPEGAVFSEKEYSFYSDYRWWGLSIFIIGFSTGMAFLANWLLISILGIFSVETPYIEGGILVLTVIGIIWGIMYIVSGTSLITDWYEVAFAVVEPYGEFFDSFLTTIMVALPFNILIAWGIANGIGIAVEIFFGNGYQIAVYVVLGIITLIQLWIMNEEYSYL